MSHKLDITNKYRLAKIKQRILMASPGKWYVEENPDCWQLFAENDDLHPWQLAKCPKVSNIFQPYWPDVADGEFIAKAREDMPWLASLAEHLFDVYDSLGLTWGDDPFAKIQELKEKANERTSQED